MHPEDKQEGSWTFRNEDGPTSTSAPATSAPSPDPAQPPVSWTASEFIAHHKDGGWYASITGAVVLLCGLIYVFTKDIISVLAIFIVFILFLIVSGSKPRQRSYTVDSHGVSIDEKFHPYSSFKSFDVAYEDAIGAITFIPLKRLMPELTIYFAPDDETKIVEVLSKSLPYDEKRQQGVHRLMRRLRF